MKIKIGSRAPAPFDGYIVYGPVFHKGEGRRFVFLVKEGNKSDRTTLAYARYLMCIELGRVLNREEEVDHKDNNKLNDVLTNLQLLTRPQNIKKSAKPLTMVKLVCDFCGTSFERRLGQDAATKKYKHTFCKMECKYSFYKGL